jgi:hypothetical protein
VCMLIYSFISYHYWHWTIEWMLRFSGNHSRHKIRLYLLEQTTVAGYMLHKTMRKKEPLS